MRQTDRETSLGPFQPARLVRTDLRAGPEPHGGWLRAMSLIMYRVGSGRSTPCNDGPPCPAETAATTGRLGCRCHGKMEGFELERLTFDQQWDLAGYAGFSPHLDAMVVAFRGTDSHSISNWAENMRYWRTDLHLPYPGAEGALVHTGTAHMHFLYWQAPEGISNSPHHRLMRAPQAITCCAFFFLMRYV